VAALGWRWKNRRGLGGLTGWAEMVEWANIHLGMTRDYKQKQIRLGRKKF
jgi:hypothetical protein